MTGTRRWGRVALALAALLGCASPRVAPQPRRALQRPLRVLLYPYVPEAEALGAALERAFEARHPDIDLQRLAASDYYGAALPRADVYELDTLLLADLVVAGQVQPLPDSLMLPRLEPLGAAAGYVSGQRYGAPRWLCAGWASASEKSCTPARRVRQPTAAGPKRLPGN